MADWDQEKLVHERDEEKNLQKCIFLVYELNVLSREKYLRGDSGENVKNAPFITLHVLMVITYYKVIENDNELKL